MAILYKSAQLSYLTIGLGGGMYSSFDEISAEPKDIGPESDAAIHKGILSPVPGDVDIYLFPDLESALLSAQFVSLAGAIPTAKCILGTMWPVVINSGTGSVESWLCNIAFVKASYRCSRSMRQSSKSWT